MRKNKDSVICSKVADYIADIENLVSGYLREDFLNDIRTNRAVCMTLVVIGEILPNMSEESLKQLSLPIREIRGLRNVLAHKYGEVNMERIWVTITEDMPVLKKDISKLSMELLHKE